MLYNLIYGDNFLDFSFQSVRIMLSYFFILNPRYGGFFSIVYHILLVLFKKQNIINIASYFLLKIKKTKAPNMWAFFPVLKHLDNPGASILNITTT